MCATGCCSNVLPQAACRGAKRASETARFGARRHRRPAPEAQRTARSAGAASGGSIGGSARHTARRLDHFALCLQSPDAVLRARSVRLTSLDKTLELAAERACNAQSRAPGTRPGQVWRLPSSSRHTGRTWSSGSSRGDFPTWRGASTRLRCTCGCSDMHSQDLIPTSRSSSATQESNLRTERLLQPAEIATGDELTLCFADGSRKAVAK